MNARPASPARSASWASRRVLLGCVLAAGAALAISISNISLPSVYAYGGDIQTFLFARYGLAFAIAIVALAVGAHRAASTSAGAQSGARPATFRCSASETGIATNLTALTAGVLYGLGALLTLGAIAYIPVTLAILILFTFPALTRLLEAAIERTVPTLGETLVLVTALAGVALALDVSFADLDRRGLAMAAGGPVCVAASFVLSERRLNHVEAWRATALLSLGGLLVASTFAAANGAFALPSEPGVLAFGLAIAGSTAAFIAMFAAIRFASAALTAMLLNLEPVLTMALAIVVIGEPVGPLRIAGAALVVGSVVIATLRSGRRAPRGNGRGKKI
ncbi:MAG: DMT family transporter [Pseudomonadota bacterium]